MFSFLRSRRRSRASSTRDGWEWVSKLRFNEHRDDRGWYAPRGDVQIFISHAFDADRTFALICERLDQLAAPLRASVRQVVVTRWPVKEIADTPDMLAYAVPEYGVMVFGGNGEFVQDMPQLPISLFAHEAAHLANPRTGGAPEDIQAQWERMMAEQYRAVKISKYDTEQYSQEIWANTVGYLTAELCGSPVMMSATKTQPDGAVITLQASWPQLNPDATQLAARWLNVPFAGVDASSLPGTLASPAATS